MKRPADIRLLLQRRFAQQHRSWLDATGQDGSWPDDIALGIPTETHALRQPDAVRAWVDEWRGWRGAGELIWAERQWRALGTQRLPASIRLHGPADLAAWAGQHERWLRAQERSRALAARWPGQGRSPGKLFEVLADYSNDDFARLMDCVAWLQAHPRSGLYLRQLPIAGLDSKWIEPRRAVVTELLALLNDRSTDAADFYELCGLRKPPQQLRIRILDPALRLRVGGLGDIIAPVEELARLDFAPSRVLIVENLQTGLTLEELDSTVAVMGLGYGVNVLPALPWLRNARCWYWGDIDTHGFAILSRARGAIPHLESLLMDEDTLVRHRHLWSVEPSQHGASELPGLSAPEADLYAKLKINSFGQAVRLEQERIDWNLAWTLIRHMVAKAD